MSDKPLKYVTDEPWWRTLGLVNYRGDSWREELEHIVAETARALRARGLDPDLPSMGVRGDQQHLLLPYQQPLIRECCEAYGLAKACLRDPKASLLGFRLGQVWGGRALASVAGPALLAMQRAAIARKRATQAAAAANRRRGEKTRTRVAKTGKVGKLTHRHVRRIVPKKK